MVLLYFSTFFGFFFTFFRIFQIFRIFFVYEDVIIEFKSIKILWFNWTFPHFLDFFGFFTFFRIFQIFRNFFFVYEDVIIKIGFKHLIQGVVHSQIRYTGFKSLKKSKNFFIFFSDFSNFFLGVYEDFFEWTTRGRKVSFFPMGA